MGTSNYTWFPCFRVVRMPKSRLGSPFNPLQSYAFDFYMTSLLFIFLKVCAYVCISELCIFRSAQKIKDNRGVLTKD